MQKKTRFRFRNKFDVFYYLVILVCAVLAVILAGRFVLNFNAQMDRLNEEPVASIIYLHKSVRRRFSDRTAWDKLKKNTGLYSGDTVYTSSGAIAQILFTDGNVLTLDENTMTRISLEPDGIFSASLIKGALTVEPKGLGSFYVSVPMEEFGDNILVTPGKTFYASGFGPNSKSSVYGYSEKKLLDRHEAAVFSPDFMDVFSDSSVTVSEKTVSSPETPVVAGGSSFIPSMKEKYQLISESTMNKEAEPVIESTVYKDSSQAQSSSRNSFANASAKLSEESKGPSVLRVLKEIFYNSPEALDYVEDLAPIPSKINANYLAKHPDEDISINLTWRGVRKATHYSVKVYSPSGSLIYQELVPASDRLFSEAKAVVSVNDPRDFPNGLYSWTVQALLIEDDSGKNPSKVSPVSTSSFNINR